MFLLLFFNISKELLKQSEITPSHSHSLKETNGGRKRERER
jgi:hypothetical protein